MVRAAAPMRGKPDGLAGASPDRSRGSAIHSAQLQTYLEGQGIQTRTVFTGNILRQPGFKDIARREAPSGYPNADRVMRSGMLAACHHGLSADDLAYVHDRFRDFAGKF